MVRVGLAELVNHRSRTGTQTLSPNLHTLHYALFTMFLLKQNTQLIAHAKCLINVQYLIDMTIKETN